MIALEEIMARLAQRRPVFCSEADFQHELAYEIRLCDPLLKVRLEWPLAQPLRGAIDLVVIGDGRWALELKYMTRGFSAVLDGEPIALKHHGALDQKRYDVWKDVARMERFAEGAGHNAGVVVLTNDPGYWQARARTNTNDAAFSLTNGRTVSGSLAWDGAAGPRTIENRESPVSIRGRYRLSWRDYSRVDGAAGHFRYLWIPVAK